MTWFYETKKEKEPWRRTHPLQELTLGSVVTVGLNLHTNDRSYTQSVWEVTAINSSHVSLKWAAGEKPIGGVERSVILLRAEHDFADASDFLTQEGFA